MRIKSLHIYPIKSCGGIELRSDMRLTERGPKHDREFMLVDENGKFISQREQPKLCMIRTGIWYGYLSVSIPGGRSVEIPLDDVKGTPRGVSVWKDQCEAIDLGPEISKPFQDFLGIKCSLVWQDPERQRIHHSDTLNQDFPVTFADGYPLLVISTASLDDLNGRLEKPLPMNRFRPNIVIEGAEPYEEDIWESFAVEALHGKPVFHFAKLCARCAITTTDQETGERGAEPLATLRKYRLDREVKGIVFGSNYRHDGPGMISVDNRIIPSN